MVLYYYSDDHIVLLLYHHKGLPHNLTTHVKSDLFLL